MIPRTPPVAPFRAALGDALERAAPAVRQHLELAGGASNYHGVIHRMWRRGPLGSMAGRFLHLANQQTTDMRLELRNALVADGDTGGAMTWRRTHYVNAQPVMGVGLIRWDAARQLLIDEIGPRRWLEVELTPHADGHAVIMRSGRQWLRLLGLRLPLPRLLVGTALTREWEEPDGRLGLSLTLHHPLAGEYAGYEALLSPRDPS